jgi:hypothetical protein
MPTAVPSKPRAPRVSKQKAIPSEPIVKKPRAPRKAVVKAPPQQISVGAGMTAGLELWTSATGQFELKDTTPDNRFAADVTVWSSLNAAAAKRGKDAA